MPGSNRRVADLLREIEELRARLADAEEHVRAFRAGEVDAVVVYEDQAERIYTLEGADHSYRVMVEQMNEAAVVLSDKRTILFANGNLAKLVREAEQNILGSSFERFIPDEGKRAFRSLFDRAREGGCAGELALLAEARRIPVHLSFSPVTLGDLDAICLLITDLTKQKRNERVLAEGQLAASILEQQAEATVICGPDGRILRASRVTEQLCGRDPVGEVLESVLPLELADGSRFWMGTVTADNPIRSVQTTYRRAGEPLTYLLLSATTLVGARREHLGWVLSLADVTEREQAAACLRESEGRLHFALETSHMGAWDLDLVDHSAYRSPEHDRIFGYSEPLPEWTYERFLEHVLPEDRTDVDAKFQQAVKIQGDWNFECRIRRVDGEVRWIWAAGRLRQEPEGAPRHMAGIVQDITDRKKTEEALRKSEALYRGIGESIDYGVWVCSPTGENLYASQSFLDMVGITQEQCSKFGWGEVLHPDDAERNIAAWKECVRTGAKWEIEHRFRGVDGQWHHVLARGVPIKGEHGEVTCWAGINLDITHLKVVEDDLREAKVAADAAARAKAEFLANMSHEIRTPMNAVIGFTDILLGTSLNPDQRRFLLLIKNSGEALLDVVNDVLDLAKMEAGRFDFVEEAFDLRDLAEKVTRSLGLRAHQKGLELTAHVPFSVPTALVGDPARLRQVLVNLLGNAIKFTERGDVHLAVRQVEPAAEGPEGVVSLRFSVRDTGIGVPREKLGLLFQSFQQVDSSSTRRHEGTGLGLFISRRIVEHMGGRIEAESVEGEGSTFSFTVPFRLRPGATAGAAEVADLRGHTVLVVDDNAANRRIVMEMLTTQGMAVALASGGEEALGLLRAAEAAGHPYELLLVDGRMPPMDGFDLIERVRADSRFPQPAIVMITSDDLPAYSARARAAGAAYLVKPVVCEELFSTVRSVLLGAGAQDDGPAEEQQPVVTAGRPLRLLLAEDNAVNQLLVRALVEREGWSIDVVADGRAAVETLSGDATYDLVLMDVQMPVLDGYEATRSLRALENHRKSRRRTPVIGLTARALPGDRQLCLDAGMDDYLSKPLEPQALLDAVQRLVAADGTGEPPAELPASLSKHPPILAKITEQFLKDYPGNMKELRDSVDRGAPGDVERAAHSLRGALLVFGARRAAEIARRLETCGREGCLDDAPSIFETLEGEVLRLAVYLEELRGS